MDFKEANKMYIRMCVATVLLKQEMWWVQPLKGTYT